MNYLNLLITTTVAIYIYIITILVFAIVLFNVIIQKEDCLFTIALFFNKYKLTTKLAFPIPTPDKGEEHNWKDNTWN